MTTAEIYRSVTDRVIAALEEGTAPWRQPWIGGFPVNAENGRRYRGVNVFLLSMMAQFKGYGDNRWGTFNTVRRVAVAEAKAEGREIVEKEVRKGKYKKTSYYEIIDGQEVWFRGGVKQGEKGTQIILWKRAEPSKAKQAALGDDAQSYLFLTSFSVFNAEQCEGIAPLVAYEHDRIAAADQIVRDYVPNGPLIQHAAGGAFYRRSDDLVNVPPLSDFHQVEAYYSTLYHELVHSTGHKSRLDRLEKTGFGTGPYAKEELVAEMGAAMLCGVAGIDNLDQSAAYVKNWLGALRDDPKFVVQAASFAQRASDLILGVTFEEKESESESQLVAA